MRALFTMFADNVGLLRKESFRELLRGLRGRPHTFAPMMHSLWASMDKGGFSPELGEDILRFNGGLFENTEAIALNTESARNPDRRGRAGLVGGRARDLFSRITELGSLSSMCSS